MFQVCGYTGLAVAVALAMGLTAARDRSLLVMTAIVAVAVATFFALAMLAKIVSGLESLTYYHHQLAVLGTTTLLLWATGQPILPYLDATIFGVGGFLVFGRIGCLMVGCCHGRPASWGVRYREAHAAAGFPAHLVGARLLPVQLLESAWTLIVVSVGVDLVLAGSAPGTALQWYLVAYAAGRFCLEFARGDAGRPYLLGFSEAQWTSLATVVAVTAAEAAGLLPGLAWPAAAVAAALAVAMAVITVRRRRAQVPRHRLLHARHVDEIAQALAAPPGSARVPDVRTTSCGIRVSAGEAHPAEGIVGHYALSSAGDGMDAATARRLAGLIVLLRHPGSEHDVVEGQHGVFHVLIRGGSLVDEMSESP
jgi:hypothetical protein